MDFDPFDHANLEDLIAFIESEGFTPGDDLRARYNDWWLSDTQMQEFIQKFMEG